MMRMTRLAVGAAIAVPLLAGAASAADTLLDYRDAAFLAGSPFYAQTERGRLAEAIAKDAPAEVKDDLGEDFSIAGDAEGSFSNGDAKEHVYLLQRQAAVAIEPFPDEPPPVLAIVGDGAPTRFVQLPEKVQYQRLVEAADVDGDGLDEVLLEASVMNMGQSTTSISVAKPDTAAGTATIVGEPQEVYFDGCDNPAGEKTRSAATVSLGKGGLTVERHTLSCGG